MLKNRSVDLIIFLVALVLGDLAASTSRADVLYAAYYGSSEIHKFTSDGADSVFANTYSPIGLAFDSAGNLYAANVGLSTIARFTPGGVGSVFASSGLSSPFGLAFDSAGNLYAANYIGNTIEKFTPKGVGSVFASSGLNGPTGLAFDSAGNLYVTNANANTIGRFTPGGVGSVFASSGLNGPQGLAFDRAGNLFATNAGAHTIVKFTPGGIGSVFANSGLTPVGLAFDSAGNLYVANESGSIAKFTPGGVGSVFATTGGSANPEYLAFTNDAGVPLPLANQVPEPASLSILALAIPALLRRRRPAPAADSGRVGVRTRREDSRTSLFKLRLAVAAVVVVVGASVGRAAITGFGSAAQLGWTSNHAGSGAAASVSGTGDFNDVLRITSADEGNINSYFFNTPQPLTVGGWTSSFTFQYTAGIATPADGVTLTLHNDPRGAGALGAEGGNLGYSGPFSSSPVNGIHGITNSESFHLNIFPGDFGGRVGIGRFVNAGGAASGGEYTSVSPVTLDSPNAPVDVSLSYDGVGTLTATLSQPSTGNMATTTFAMPSAQQVLGGGNSFFVGFTGATGGLTAAQQISNFRFVPVGAQVAPSLNIFKFSDPVVGVNAVPGAGTAADSPDYEAAPDSIDSAQPSKYLNFNTLSAGIMVTPAVGATIATQLGLTSANDAPERDPASYEVWGTNNTNLNDTSPVLNPGQWQNSWTLIAHGTVPEFTGRGQEQAFTFSNSTAYLSYLVDFPTIADATEANSMQIADIQLSAAVPEPASLSILALAVPALLRRRKRVTTHP